MNRPLYAVSSAVLMLIVCATVASAQSVPNTSTQSDSSAGTASAQQTARERCKADPQKCREELKARIGQRCKDNSQQCEEAQARRARRREECKADPEKCRAETRARFEQRFKKADADGNGTLSRAEAQKSMPVIARHFDEIDANKDGQISLDEIKAAEQARAAQRKDKALNAPK